MDTLPQLQDEIEITERAVLGAILLEPASFGEVSILLQSHFFSTRLHTAVYEAAASLWYESKPIDKLTVIDRLKTAGVLESVGGMMGVIQLTQGVVGAGNIRHHAIIIIQEHMRRELIRWGNAVIYGCNQEGKDLFTLMNDARAFLDNLENLVSNGKDAIADHAGKVLDQMGSTNTERIYKCGNPALDNNRGGLVCGGSHGELTYLGGLSGQGKTVDAVNVCLNAAKNGAKVLFATFELSAEEVTVRMLANESGVPSMAIRKGDSALSDEQQESITKAYHRLMQLPIRVVDSYDSLQEMQAGVIQAIRNDQCDVLVIDYLQNIEVTGVREDWKRVKMVSNTLAKMCRKQKIAIYCLAQISMAKGEDIRQATIQYSKKAAFADAYNIIYLYRKDFGDGADLQAKNAAARGSIEYVTIKTRDANINHPNELLWLNPETGKLSSPDDFAKEINGGNMPDFYHTDSPF